MNYKNKYIKYKAKYLKLKGGRRSYEEIPEEEGVQDTEEEGVQDTEEEGVKDTDYGENILEVLSGLTKDDINAKTKDNKEAVKDTDYEIQLKEELIKLQDLRNLDKSLEYVSLDENKEFENKEKEDEYNQYLEKKNTSIPEIKKKLTENSNKEIESFLMLEEDMKKVLDNQLEEETEPTKQVALFHKLNEQLSKEKENINKREKNKLSYYLNELYNKLINMFNIQKLSKSNKIIVLGIFSIILAQIIIPL